MISPGDPRSTDALAFKYSTDILLASQSTYEQKQAAWKQLRDAGKLDPLIGDLERRAVEDPRSAVCAATLGQAYLQKCGAIQDIREQGILAMQADKVFDTALNLDSWNWEARFTKAVAMSYWPANMNKGQEVVQHFQTLVQQQEAQAPQPQFAETYLWLGDQYQKAGQTDEARTTWERGATLFPNHDKLRSRLAPAQ
jgi:tetratricopeptide (TPR) repeat protein